MSPAETSVTYQALQAMTNIVLNLLALLPSFIYDDLKEHLQRIWAIEEEGKMGKGAIIVGICVLGGVVISVVAILSEAMGKRAVGQKELKELRQDISQMKVFMDEIREQLADIIIRLG